MKKYKKLIKIGVIVLMVALLALYALSDRLIIRHYNIETEKVDNHIRIVQLSDLHSCNYGENQHELLDAVYEADPDIVVLTGDIFDDEIENTNTEIVIQGLAERYPVYYISGNHDCWASSDFKRDQRRILNENNVVVLRDISLRISVNGELIDLCGIQDPAKFVKKSQDNRHHDEGYVRGQMWMLNHQGDEEVMSILLAHRPEFQDIYDQWDFDLILSGHTHGGVIRIPYLMNGIYAWGQGFFPAFSGGLYVLDNSVMIISRGLSRESSGKRVFNRPELVVIDIW